MMRKLTIRVKLLLLSGLLMLLLVASSLYMRSQIVSGGKALTATAATLSAGTDALKATSQTLKDGTKALRANSDALQTNNAALNEITNMAARLQLATDAMKVFGEVKYWFTDLAVSWLNESEENADTAKERLDGILEKLAQFAPKKVEAIKEHIEVVSDKSLEAVDAYVDGNRVLGNSLLAEARDSNAKIDTILVALAGELRKNSEQVKSDAILVAEAALKPATEAVTKAQAAFAPVQQATEAAKVSVVSSKQFVASAERASSFSIILLIAALVIAVGLTLFIIRSITLPLDELTSVMGKLADGNNDVIIGTGEVGELGAMSRAVEVFKQSAIRNKELEADHVKQEQRAEQEKQEIMQTLADDFETNVGGIIEAVAASAAELNATAQSMSSIAEETSSQATTVAAASEEASANVQTVVCATEEMTASISEINQQVGDASQASKKAVEDVLETTGQMNALMQTADKIGDVVSLISDIAEQTNLLALNATIESARAGEAGKGFAVVASEVKTLANETAKATEHISEHIEEMQSATGNAVKSIDGIRKIIEKLEESSTAIAAAMEEQGATTQEVTRNIHGVALGTKDVSSNITGVTKASQKAGASAGKVTTASGELSKQAELMKSEVQKFLKQVRTT